MSTGIIEFLTIFVLAVFVGNEVIGRVPCILHTPLMSGSNAIHGIVLVGAILIMGSAHGTVQITLAFLAVILATAQHRRRLRGHRPDAARCSRPSRPTGPPSRGATGQTHRRR